MKKVYLLFIVFFSFSLALEAGIPPAGPPYLVDVRFSLDTFDCPNSEVCFDVQFRATSDADMDLIQFNHRFFYNSDVLTFKEYRNFVPGLTPSLNSPVPGLGGPFGWPGGAVYRTDVIDFTGTPPIIPLFTYETFYQVCFDVISPTQGQAFCPYLVWDQNPNNPNDGLAVASDGIMMSVLPPGESDPNNSTQDVNERGVDYNYFRTSDTPVFGTVRTVGCITPDCTPVVPVPTMSEWGLFLFGLSLLTMMMVSLYNYERRKRTT